MKRMIPLATELAALFTLILVTTSTAQVPRLINFQGRLTEPDTGKPYPDGPYSITFRLYDQPEGGEAVWEELQTLQLVGGMFNAVLGNIEPLTPPFTTDLWLTTQVESDPEMLPRARLCSAPYAINADMVDGKHADELGGFPPPDYDSGFQSIAQGQTKTFTHDLGGSIDDYVVMVDAKDTYYGVHQVYYGGLYNFWDDGYQGFNWRRLTDSTIGVARCDYDVTVEYVRVRIWVIRD